MIRAASLPVLAVALLLVMPVRAAVNEVLDFGSEIFADPFPAAQRAALRNEVPLEGFAYWSERHHLVAGDSATILVTSTHGQQRKQWLILLRAEARDLLPVKNKPAQDVILFTNSGREIRFADAPARLAMHAWGPFLDSTTEEDVPEVPGSALEPARDRVNETFLGLGFARACEAMMHLHQARAEGRLARDNLFSVGIKPFSGRDLERGLQVAEATGFTPEDERAIAGAVPALMEYFDIASRSPGIRDVVWALLEKPSVWSVIRRIGRIESGVTFHAKGVAPVAPDPWALPAATRAYKLPLTLELNDKPGLQCVLVVTEPQPPLLISGGILGLYVRSPRDDGKRLFLRVVAARAAVTTGFSD